MSCKSRLYFLSVFALSLVCLTSEVFAQGANPSDAKPAAQEQAANEESNAKPRPQDETDENDHSGMTLEELTADFKKEYRAYVKRYRAASPTEKRNVTGTNPRGSDYRARLIELINENPGSQAGIDAIDWWLQRGGRDKHIDIILGLAVKHYSKLESIEKYTPYFAWKLPADEAEKHIRVLLEDNPFDVVQARASFELHEILRGRLEELDDKSIASAKSLKAEMKVLRDAVFNQYADIADVNGSMLVDRLTAVDFAEKLKIGKPIPDIVGTDLEGVDFRLSDYDGKVRVLTFWGHW